MMEATWPGVWPGQWRTSKVSSPTVDRVTVVQPARGRERPAWDALRTRPPQALDPEDVRLVRPLDLDAELLGEDARRPAMVDMAMGQENFLDRYASLRAAAFSRGRSPPGSTKAPTSFSCTIAECNSAAGE